MEKIIKTKLIKQTVENLAKLQIDIIGFEKDNDKEAMLFADMIELLCNEAK